MKRLHLLFALAIALVLSSSVWAQSYSFTRRQRPRRPAAPFTQLLGINNSMVIAGYQNFINNKGFVLVLPRPTSPRRTIPNSTMTQVIGINNSVTTSGFYVDTNCGHPRLLPHHNGTFTNVDFPGTPFNQLLRQNDHQQASGYYSLSSGNTTPDFPYVYDEVGGIFEVITIPGAVGGAQATGINNSGEVCGFFIDSTRCNHGWLLNAGIFISSTTPAAPLPRLWD